MYLSTLPKRRIKVRQALEGGHAQVAQLDGLAARVAQREAVAKAPEERRRLATDKIVVQPLHRGLPAAPLEAPLVQGTDRLRDGPRLVVPHVEIVPAHLVTPATPSSGKTSSF